ncbi:DUF4153 domain-containing protein [Clostridium aminobutyricum]|uniref:DUF4173 domain-containing protein n=1 Tax=Clostridium aminobutyricum TaxID=33953 RepID=A0A939D9C5_CLOAM|nr:DUF4173 domain-containing protein [Clostridium aminobutyricum]MBN7773520.1 DUF4173 domain-containing protein [Clostridium aminobutyricum]
MKYYYAESGETSGNSQLHYRNKWTAEPMKFSTGDSWFAAAMLVCGFLYWNLIHFASLSAGVTIFTVILCVVVWSYLNAKGINQTKKSLPWLGLVGLTALLFFLFDDFYIKQFSFMLLSAAFLYWVCRSTGRSLDSTLSVYVLGDAVNQGLLLPFSNFTCGYFGLQDGLKKSKHGRNLIYAAAGIVVFLPLMVLVITQLSNADMAFEQLIDRILNAISIETITEYALQFVVGIPVALYLYGAVYGNISGRHSADLNKNNLIKFAQGIRFAPKLTIYTALTVFNAIYLLFFFSQTTYLFSAFGDVLPNTMTYAEYARRGFFELCKVCTINMGILIAANCFMKRNETMEKQSMEWTETPKMLKIQMSILAVFTILLIVTALSKMAMYIHYYGLTQHRVYAAWFMLALLFTFVVIVARQIKAFNASRIITIGWIAAFLILAYGNVDGNIAKYDMERYEKGTLESLDYKMLFDLSDAAVPYLYEHYQHSTDEKERTILYSGITGRYSWGVVTEPYEKTFRDFNLQAYRAEKIRSILAHEEGRNNPENLSDGEELYPEASYLDAY